MSDRWKEASKVALFVLGAGLLAWSIYTVGPRTILEVAGQGIAFLPLITVACALFYLLESQGQRSMLGVDANKIPLVVFVRATLSSLIATLLLPFGRVGGEVLRVAAYAPHVGAARATAASTTFQIATFLSTALYALICYFVAGSSLGFGSVLAWVLLVYTMGSATLGGILLLLVRGATLGRRLARFFPRFVASAAAFDEAADLPGKVFLRAIAWCLAARAAEVAQYAAILLAVGLPFSIGQSVIAGGLQVVGSTIGEAIPNQLGTIEGAFVYFSEALGLGREPARALALPLLARAAHFTLAAISLGTLCFLSPGSARLVERRTLS